MDNIYHRDNARPTIVELDEMTQFIRSVYYWSLGYMLATVAMWALISVFNWHPHRFLPFPIYVLVIVVFLVMVLLHCIPQMGNCSPCKWILVVLVVLCTTFAGYVVLHSVGLLTSFIVIACVAVVILVLNFSGSKCPQEFLPGGVISTLLMILLLVTLLFVGIAQLATGSEELLSAFVSILFIMVVIAILIQAQFNHGRLNSVVEVSPKYHQIVCILTLYLHTMMFLLCICYFIYVEEKRQLAISLTTKDDIGYYTSVGPGRYRFKE